ncbi:monomeric [FeFe] hydrogenase [Spirochaeta isovalerica]|uniref:[FeFe] hydrogenase (Group B1/B3) n=1 Tax=Spirochaeta isovalerica TaxID=150 RepID=A0A841RHH3_9SPIO|nr:monomeric [FeFe] hydrogenase [Spirochaeta isovalerica]MBB6482460.1 [FeFe] hydrogenase (group B1/B3) [Spirochaeta isovalerica]
MLNENNQYSYLRKELLLRFFNFLFDSDNTLDINKIPYAMIPSKGDPRRCCIYKDREMIKYRLLSLMGYDLSGDFDESPSLFEFFSRCEKEKAPSLPPLSVISAACSSCRNKQYRVTELCRGCLARPCQTICPAGALTMKNGKAIIDGERCVNCGKCQKACPYSAIVYIPVPCEEVCPVGAIVKKEGHAIEIDRQKCISCGRCTRSCPFGAIVEKSHAVPLAAALKLKKDISLMIAPSLYNQLPGSDSQILEALKAIGFTRVYELQESAEIVAAEEGRELVERMEKGESFMTTSCCPAYVETVKKHMPDLASHVSRTPSPMVAGAEILKDQFPHSTIVFAGPCMAKKVEAYENGIVDLVMNFEELGTLLISRAVEILNYPEVEREPVFEMGRGFAHSGGVARAVEASLGRKVGYGQIDGISSKTLRLMKTWTKRAPSEHLVEVMACEGGCSRGPCSLNS